jgi:hypothetical protein
MDPLPEGGRVSLESNDLWGRQGPSICQQTTHEVLIQQTLTLGRKKNRVMHM